MSAAFIGTAKANPGAKPMAAVMADILLAVKERKA
jgi:hypothetical protein